jgi:hypothetical protein
VQQQHLHVQQLQQPVHLQHLQQQQVSAEHLLP